MRLSSQRQGRLRLIQTSKTSSGKTRAVVLFSGGLDSAVTLEWALRKGWECFPLFFHYGQSNYREIHHAQELVQSYFVPKYKWCHQLRICDISGYGALCINCVMTNGSSSQSFEDPKDINVPNRFVVFMALASALAVSLKARYICSGVQVEHHLTDFQGAYDAHANLVHDCEVMAQSYSAPGKSHIFVRAPLLNKGKKDIHNLASKWGVPSELTWSCLRGLEKPCGNCVSCRQYKLTGVPMGGTLKFSKGGERPET